MFGLVQCGGGVMYCVFFLLVLCLFSVTFGYIQAGTLMTLLCVCVFLAANAVARQMTGGAMNPLYLKISHVVQYFHVFKEDERSILHFKEWTDNLKSFCLDTNSWWAPIRLGTTLLPFPHFKDVLKNLICETNSESPDGKVMEFYSLYLREMFPSKDAGRDTSDVILPRDFLHEDVKFRVRVFCCLCLSLCVFRVVRVCVLRELFIYEKAFSMCYIKNQILSVFEKVFFKYFIVFNNKLRV